MMPARADAAGPARPGNPARRRGRFVVLVGPDGVGKTTVARALAESHDGPTAYFHFLPALTGGMRASPPEGPAAPLPKATGDGSRPLGWARLCRSCVRGWAGYLATVHPAMRRGTLVVGDRWLYGYAVQPAALRFYGPHALAAAALHLLPRPDLVAVLHAPPQVIRARKQELSEAQVQLEMLSWERLPGVRAELFDAMEPPSTIARRILQQLDLPAQEWEADR